MIIYVFVEFHCIETDFNFGVTSIGTRRTSPFLLPFIIPPYGRMAGIYSFRFLWRNNCLVPATLFSHAVLLTAMTLDMVSDIGA